MAVRVIISRYNNGNPYGVATYPEADHVTTTESGLLFVKKDLNTTTQTLAVFAPGNWVSAEVVGSGEHAVVP